MSVSNREGWAESGLGRRTETRNRTVRIRNLPLDTQEGLLHQALEKYANVHRTEFFADTGEAVVELTSAAVRFRSCHAFGHAHRLTSVIRKQASCCCGQSRSFLMVLIWRYLRNHRQVRLELNRRWLRQARRECLYRVQQRQDQERVWGVHANLVLVPKNHRLAPPHKRQKMLEGKDRMISGRCWVDRFLVVL